MASLLERKLIVVTGKGGAGKTTIAGALGLLASDSGLRTIVVELGAQHRLPSLFDHDPPPSESAEVQLRERLWSVSIDPERALFDWLGTLAGRLSTRMLAASSTFRYFAAAAPGARELVCMIKIRTLCEGDVARGVNGATRGAANGAYDLVVLDAPATGHALAMLRSPQTFSAIVRAGPLADAARGVRDLLADPARSGYLAVAHATEMAVTETLDLEQGLRRELDRDLDAVIVNCVVPRRFTREELAKVTSVAGARAPNTGASDARMLDARSDARMSDARASDARPADAETPDAHALLARACADAARASYERSRRQSSQLARLRRQRFAQGRPPRVLTVPFAFAHEIDAAAVREIAAGLQRKL